jgi:Holliday junction resolvase RusA-like endonuclease
MKKPSFPVHALVLPWPDRRLHPNSRPHWGAKSKATKAARHNAHLCALEAGWHLHKLPEGRLHLWIDFYPPDKRRRDDDGLLSSLKAARDGIADALNVDDSRFVSHPYLKDETHPGGRVEIRITGAPAK